MSCRKVKWEEMFPDEMAQAVKEHPLLYQRAHGSGGNRETATGNRGTATVDDMANGDGAGERESRYRGAGFQPAICSGRT